MRFILPKSEILRGFKSFTRVITEGKSISSAPVRCYYCRTAQDPPQILAGFSVSRGIRRAVDRNKAKRLMRESYRLNKFLLARGETTHQKSFEIVFMYTGRLAGLRGGTTFADVDRSMQHILKVIGGEEV